MVEIVRASVLGSLPHGFMPQSHRGNDGSSHEDREADRLLAARAILPGAQLISARQIHSAQAVIATEPWSAADAPQADAVVTTLPGLLVGVVTADCAPVLLADAKAGVVAAAHAGWRGAASGIIEASVAAMEQCGANPARISAAIGPAIAQESYEVDEEFRTFFSAADERYFKPGRKGHFQFDLEAYVAAKLREAGVGMVEPLGIDTYTAPDRYHSFRRATHRGTQAAGRQFSAIALPRVD